MKNSNNFFHKFSSIGYYLVGFIIAGLIVLTLVPGGYGLWYDKLNVNVTVSTGDLTHPRSKGYWCKEFKVYFTGHGHAHINYTTIISYLNEISNESLIFDFTGLPYERIVYAYYILGCGCGCHNNHQSMEQKLEAQLLALWLNYVSGYADGYVLDLGNTTVLTAMDIINMSETALINGDSGVYESLKDLAEEFNTRWEKSC